MFSLHYCRERTEFFAGAETFFLSVCLMGWNTLVWFVCIWICSGESQVIISLNLDWDIRIGFLGLSFFFFFFVYKRLGLFYKGLRFTFLFLDERIGVWKWVYQTHRTIFFKEFLRVSFLRAWVVFFYFWVNGLEAVLLGLCFISWISPCFILSETGWCLKRCLTNVPYEILNN